MRKSLILSVLVLFMIALSGCNAGKLDFAGQSSFPGEIQSDNRNSLSHLGNFQETRELTNAIVIDGQETVLLWENTRITIPAGILSDGTIIRLIETEITGDLAWRPVNAPVKIKIDQMPDKVDSIPITMIVSGLPVSNSPDKYDLVKCTVGNNGNLNNIGFGWAKSKDKTISKTFAYDPNAVFVVMNMGRFQTRQTSSYGPGVPKLTYLDPNADPPQASPGKKIHLVMVHGLAVTEDLAATPAYSSHWMPYAWFDNLPNPFILDGGYLNQSEKDQIQVWWFYYYTFDNIFGPSGNGTILANKIREQILTVNPDSTIIFAGYSMGALVSLAAYDSLQPNGTDSRDYRGQVKGLITMNGVNMGTEWVNVALENDMAWFLGVPREPGVRDLRSKYKLDGTLLMLFPPYYKRYYCNAADSPNLTLNELHNLYYGKYRANDQSLLVGDSKWFYPVGSFVRGGFTGLLSTLLGEEFMASIENYSELPDPPSSVDAKHTLLHGYPPINPPLDFTLHDGLVAYYSQLGYKLNQIPSSRDSFFNHGWDHLQVIDSQKSNVIALLQQNVGEKVSHVMTWETEPNDNHLIPAGNDGGPDVLTLDYNNDTDGFEYTGRLDNNPFGKTQGDLDLYAFDVPTLTHKQAGVECLASENGGGIRVTVYYSNNLVQLLSTVIKAGDSLIFPANFSPGRYYIRIESAIVPPLTKPVYPQRYNIIFR